MKYCGWSTVAPRLIIGAVYRELKETMKVGTECSGIDGHVLESQLLALTLRGPVYIDKLA